MLMYNSRNINKKFKQSATDSCFALLVFAIIVELIQRFQWPPMLYDHFYCQFRR